MMMMMMREKMESSQRQEMRSVMREEGEMRKVPKMYWLRDDYKSQQESINNHNNNSKGETKRIGMIQKYAINVEEEEVEEAAQLCGGLLLEESGLNFIRWQQQQQQQHKHKHLLAQQPTDFSLLTDHQDHVFNLHNLLALHADHQSHFLRVQEAMACEHFDQTRAQYIHSKDTLSIASEKQSKDRNEEDDGEVLGATRRDDEHAAALSLSLTLQQTTSPLFVQKSSNVSSTNVSEISDQAVSSNSSASTNWDVHRHRHHPNLDLSISLCGS